MKYINAEKSCVLDVNIKRTGELERAGWKPYFEAEEQKKAEVKENIEAKTESKTVRTSREKTNKTNKGKSK